MANNPKEKYTQDIAKLVPASARVKEQIVGRVLACWKETLNNGKTKVLATVIDGEKMNNVLTMEAWSDADQAHALRVLMPMVGQVVRFQKVEIANKGKTPVFHIKRLKMCFDKTTEVHSRQDDKKFPEALPLLELHDIRSLHTMCTISVQACVQDCWGPTPRSVDGGEKLVTNLKVALGDTQIEVAFLGNELATEMGQAMAGDV